jgi:signal transduction histidine kinase/HPt (histidine-containing phosphotransfer) domain-containing protein/ActR/RegA family two-component response regulator
MLAAGPAAEASLLDVLEASPIGVTILDESGQVMFWNSRLIDMLGGLQGEDFGEAAALNFFADQAMRQAVMAEFRATGVVREVEVALLRGDRAEAWASLTMQRVEFEGRPGALAWIYDISAQRRAQATSEAAARAKSAFLATMSHEIRTPMNGVVTMAELLAETRLSRDQAGIVRTISESGRALLTIINDILDFSKIEAGKLEIELMACELRPLVDGVAALLAPKAAEKGLEFVVEIAGDTPEWVQSDPTRLRQILLNLTANAIKFTEAGQVAIRICPAELGLYFEVADTGIGISEEQQGALFRAFSQAEMSTARKFGGTGLGLSICQGLIDLMDGAIGVESAPTLGATFWFELPAPACPAPPRDSADSQLRRPRRWTAPDPEAARAHDAVILCAEDNATNREVLGRVLQRLGLAYEMVENGALALAALDTRGYGLLLTDCHMPVLDGWALARAVRRREQAAGAPPIPIIALTADAVKGTDARCRAAGMDGYLTKPVALDTVEQAIADHLPAALALRAPAETQGVGIGGLLAAAEDTLDLNVLAELIGDDQDEIRKLLAEFPAAARPLVEGVLTLIEREPAEAQRAAHSLKSAARYVGAQALGDAAAVVEQALEELRVEDARAAAEALPPSLDAVEQAIATLALGQQLIEMRSEIGRLAETPGQDDPAAIGLEAVVDITEQAASKILEAAETIAARVARIGDGDEARLIQQQLTAIFEACSFQDLTSQRVRRAIARLTAIEEQLDHAVRRFNHGDPGADGAEPERPDDPVDDVLAEIGPLRRQDEVDKLIAG